MVEAMLEEKNAVPDALVASARRNPARTMQRTDLAWLKALTYQRGQMAYCGAQGRLLPVVYASAADRLADKTAASIMAATPHFG